MAKREDESTSDRKEETDSGSCANGSQRVEEMGDLVRVKDP